MQRFPMPDDDAEHYEGNLLELRYLTQVKEAGDALVAFERQANVALAVLRKRESLSLMFLVNVAYLQHQKLPSLDFYPTRYAVNTEMVEPSDDGELVRYREYESLLQSSQIVLRRVEQVKQTLTAELKAADRDYVMVQKS